MTNKEITALLVEGLDTAGIFVDAEALANTKNTVIGKSQDSAINFKRSAEAIMKRLAKMYVHAKSSNSTEDVNKIVDLLKVLTDKKKKAQRVLDLQAGRFSPPEGSNFDNSLREGFDLKQFLVENKLTTNSKHKE